MCSGLSSLVKDYHAIDYRILYMTPNILRMRFSIFVPLMPVVEPSRLVRCLVLYPVLCDLPALFRFNDPLERWRNRLAALLFVLNACLNRMFVVCGIGNSRGFISLLHRVVGRAVGIRSIVGIHLVNKDMIVVNACLLVGDGSASFWVFHPARNAVQLS